MSWRNNFKITTNKNMGRMKELYMQELMELGMYDQNMLPPEDYELSNDSEILCPNCTMEYLSYGGEDEMYCTCCGQEFKIIDKNKLIFKETTL